MGKAASALITLNCGYFLPLSLAYGSSEAVAEVLLFLPTTSSFLPLNLLSLKTPLFSLASLSKYQAGPWPGVRAHRAKEKSHETSVAKCSLIRMITIRLQTQPHLLLTYCWEAMLSFFSYSSSYSKSEAPSLSWVFFKDDTRSLMKSFQLYRLKACFYRCYVTIT